MCHYCDFPKTANWDRRFLTEYIASLNRHLRAWLTFSRERKLSFDTVFFGGGTPGLFTHELEPLFQTMSEFGTKAQEVTLEANPENVTPANLRLWKQLGVNRLSLGVQTFQTEGLKLLTRQNSAETTLQALEYACADLDNVSIDLIYGWPGQSGGDWHGDLLQALKFPLSHLSLYCLMFEEKTPLGRSFRRGQIRDVKEDDQVTFYEHACEVLKAGGFTHYECSNWARNGKECRHNIKYWQNASYIGIGAGACGYLADEGVGLRYSYKRNERSFVREPDPDLSPLSSSSLDVEERTNEDWLRETIGCGLRYREGIDLGEIEKRGFVFKPQGLVAEALSDGRLVLMGHRLRLSESEWFRETCWCVEVLSHF